MKAEELIQLLTENQYKLIAGVPDSIFKDFLTSINHTCNLQHIICNNEGEACSIACGFHLATNQIPIVYMQNSGLGNCINPLTSLLDPLVYSIPVLLLISWRAKPGEKADEAQHLRMGKITANLLELLDIPWMCASTDIEKMKSTLLIANNYFIKKKSAFAILFPSGTISASENENIKKKERGEYGNIVREDLLRIIHKNQKTNDIFIATTGKISREIFELREIEQVSHEKDFLTVGSMGCASAIALGIALQKPKHRIVLIDGDGACLMRMEHLATIGHYQPNNLLHIIIDNNAYESTGSQPTLSKSVKLEQVAKACGYQNAQVIKEIDEFKTAYCSNLSGPSVIVVKSNTYSRLNLGRPTITPIENKEAFMKNLLKNKLKA